MVSWTFLLSYQPHWIPHLLTHPCNSWRFPPQQTPQVQGQAHQRRTCAQGIGGPSPCGSRVLQKLQRWRWMQDKCKMKEPYRRSECWSLHWRELLSSPLSNSTHSCVHNSPSMFAHLPPPVPNIGATGGTFSSQVSRDCWGSWWCVPFLHCVWLKTWTSLHLVCLTRCSSHPLVLYCLWDIGPWGGGEPWPCIKTHGYQPQLGLSLSQSRPMVVVRALSLTPEEQGGMYSGCVDDRNTWNAIQCNNQPWRQQK